MKSNKTAVTGKVVRTGKPGRPKGLKIAWPTGALLLNLFKFNKDAAIADKLNTSVPGVFMKRRRLNKFAESVDSVVGKFSYVPPEKRSTGSKKKAAEPVAAVETEVQAEA